MSLLYPIIRLEFEIRYVTHEAEVWPCVIGKDDLRAEVSEVTEQPEPASQDGSSGQQYIANPPELRSEE